MLVNLRDPIMPRTRRLPVLWPEGAVPVAHR